MGVGIHARAMSHICASGPKQVSQRRQPENAPGDPPVRNAAVQPLAGFGNGSAHAEDVAEDVHVRPERRDVAAHEMHKRMEEKEREYEEESFKEW